MAVAASDASSRKRKRSVEVEQPDHAPPFLTWLKNYKAKFYVWGKKYLSDPDELYHILQADDLHDPLLDLELASKHCGLHDIMLERTYNNPLFYEKASELINVLKQYRHYQDPEDAINMGICCKAGRHRSVGVEYLLRKLLVQYGCKVSKPTYAERDAGHWRHLCYSCACCKEQSPHKGMLQKELYGLAKVSNPTYVERAV